MDHKIKETFACVKASDDTVKAVLNIPAEQEAPRRFSHWQVVRRVAACAAMLALLIGAMVLPGKDGEPAPFFTIHVYANETGSNAGAHFPGYDSAPPSSQKTMFFVDVWLDTDLSIFMPNRESERPTLRVLCNGEIVDAQDKNIMIGLLASTTSDDVGYSVAGRVDKPSMLEIILTAPDNSILQKCFVLVMPALFDGYVVKLIYTYVSDAYDINT